LNSIVFIVFHQFLVPQPKICSIFAPRTEKSFLQTLAVLGKNIWGSGPSSFRRQQWLSETTIEPIKNLGAWARFGGLCLPALA